MSFPEFDDTTSGMGGTWGTPPPSDDDGNSWGTPPPDDGGGHDSTTSFGAPDYGQTDSGPSDSTTSFGSPDETQKKKNATTDFGNPDPTTPGLTSDYQSYTPPDSTTSFGSPDAGGYSDYVSPADYNDYYGGGDEPGPYPPISQMERQADARNNSQGLDAVADDQSNLSQRWPDQTDAGRFGDPAVKARAQGQMADAYATDENNARQSMPNMGEGYGLTYTSPAQYDDYFPGKLEQRQAYGGPPTPDEDLVNGVRPQNDVRLGNPPYDLNSLELQAQLRAAGMMPGPGDGSGEFNPDVPLDTSQIRPPGQVMKTASGQTLVLDDDGSGYGTWKIPGADNPDAVLYRDERFGWQAISRSDAQWLVDHGATPDKFTSVSNAPGIVAEAINSTGTLRTGRPEPRPLMDQGGGNSADMNLADAQYGSDLQTPEQRQDATTSFGHPEYTNRAELNVPNSGETPDESKQVSDAYLPIFETQHQVGNETRQMSDSLNGEWDNLDKRWQDYADAVNSGTQDRDPQFEASMDGELRDLRARTDTFKSRPDSYYDDRFTPLQQNLDTVRGQVNDAIQGRANTSALNDMAGYDQAGEYKQNDAVNQATRDALVNLDATAQSPQQRLQQPGQDELARVQQQYGTIDNPRAYYQVQGADGIYAGQWIPVGNDPQQLAEVQQRANLPKDDPQNIRVVSASTFGTQGPPEATTVPTTHVEDLGNIAKVAGVASLVALPFAIVGAGAIPAIPAGIGITGSLGIVAGSYLLKGTGEHLGDTVHGGFGGVLDLVGGATGLTKVTDAIKNMPIPEAAQNPLSTIEQMGQYILENPGRRLNPVYLAADIYKNGIAEGGLKQAYNQSDQQFALSSGLQKAGLEYLATSAVQFNIGLAKDTVSDVLSGRRPSAGIGDFVRIANPVGDYTNIFQANIDNGFTPDQAAADAFNRTNNGVASVIRSLDLFNPLMYAVEVPFFEDAVRGIFKVAGIGVRGFLDSGATGAVGNIAQGALGNTINPRGAFVATRAGLDLFTTLSTTSAVNIANEAISKEMFTQIGRIGEKNGALADLYEMYLYKSNPEVWAQRIADYSNTYLKGQDATTKALSERLGNGFTARMVEGGAKPDAIPGMIETFANTLRSGDWASTPELRAASDATTRKYVIRPAEIAKRNDYTAFELAKADVLASLMRQSGLPVIPDRNAAMSLFQAGANSLRSLYLLPGASALAIKKIGDEFIRGGLTGVWGLRPADFQLVRTGASRLIERGGTLGAIGQRIEDRSAVRIAMATGTPVDDYLLRAPVSRYNLGDAFGRNPIDNTGRKVTTAGRLEAVFGAPGRFADKYLQTLVSSPTQHLRTSAAFRELKDVPAIVRSFADELMTGLVRDRGLPQNLAGLIRTDLARATNQQDYYEIAQGIRLMDRATSEPSVPTNAYAKGRAALPTPEGKRLPINPETGKAPLPYEIAPEKYPAGPAWVPEQPGVAAKRAIAEQAATGTIGARIQQLGEEAASGSAPLADAADGGMGLRTPLLRQAQDARMGGTDALDASLGGGRGGYRNFKGQREGATDELVNAYREGRANPESIIAQARQQFGAAYANADIDGMWTVEERLLDHAQAAAAAKNTAAKDALTNARVELFGPATRSPQARAAQWDAVREQAARTEAMRPRPRPEISPAGGASPIQTSPRAAGAINRGMADQITDTGQYEAWQAAQRELPRNADQWQYGEAAGRQDRPFAGTGITPPAGAGSARSEALALPEGQLPTTIAGGDRAQFAGQARGATAGAAPGTGAGSTTGNAGGLPPFMRGPGYPRMPQPPTGNPDYQGAADDIEKQGRLFAQMQLGRGNAALERGNAIVGNFRQQTPIGELMTQGTINGRGPGIALVPFAPFHIHTTQYWAEYFLQHPQAAYAIANALNQYKFDEYGGKQVGNQYVSGMLDMSTAAHLIHWAQGIYDYAREVAATPGNNPLQKAAKIGGQALFGNEAYVRPFDYVATPAQAVLQSTTNPLIQRDKNGQPKIDPETGKPMVDKREQIAEQGSATGPTGLIQYLNDRLDLGQPWAQTRNVISGVTNPGQVITNKIRSGAVNAVDRLGGNADLSSYQADKQLPYFAGDYAQRNGLDPATVERALYAPKSKEDERLGSQIRFEYARQQDQNAIGKLLPVHASEETNAKGIFPPFDKNGPVSYSPGGASGRPDFYVNRAEWAGSKGAQFESDKTALAMLKSDNPDVRGAAETYLNENADKAFNYQRNAGTGGRDLGTGVPAGSYTDKNGVPNGYYVESPEQSRYSTARADIAKANPVTPDAVPYMDYNRDYLGRPDIAAMGSAKQQESLAGEIAGNVSRTGANLPPDQRAGQIAKEQTLQVELAPGFTAGDLFGQPGNIYSIEKEYADAKKAGASKETLAAIGKRIDDAKAKDLAQFPGTQAYFDMTDAASQAKQTGPGTFYGGLTPAEKNAYDAFNDLRGSADYKRYQELEAADRAAGAYGTPGEKAWYAQNKDELNRLKGVVATAEQSIQDRFGVNPKELANRSSVAAGRSPVYADTTLTKQPGSSSATSGSAGSSSLAGLSPAEQQALDSFNTLRDSTEYKRYQELQNQERAAGAYGTPGEKAWYEKNKTELNKLKDFVEGTEAAIAQKFGANPKEAANKVAVAAGRQPTYANTDIKGVATSASASTGGADGGVRAQIVAKAMEAIGTDDFANFCEQYVEQAVEAITGRRGATGQREPSASVGYQHAVAQGLGISEDEAQAGDLVYYPDAAGGVGHVAVYMGNGQQVSTLDVGGSKVHVEGILSGARFVKVPGLPDAPDGVALPASYARAANASAGYSGSSNYSGSSRSSGSSASSASSGKSGQAASSGNAGNDFYNLYRTITDKAEKAVVLSALDRAGVNPIGQKGVSDQTFQRAIDVTSNALGQKRGPAASSGSAPSSTGYTPGTYTPGTYTPSAKPSAGGATYRGDNGALSDAQILAGVPQQIARQIAAGQIPAGLIQRAIANASGQAGTSRYATDLASRYGTASTGTASTTSAKSTTAAAASNVPKGYFLGRDGKLHKSNYA